MRVTIDRPVAGDTIICAMMGDLPKALQDAMERLLDADTESHGRPTPSSNVERIERLRAARAIAADWRRGEVELEEAVRRIESLVATARA